ncbi:MAG: efflux RND transporter periplasmic adaptor subunit [Pseudomonadota bacterium]|uniref:efflux RND transporter periplasmic adaptor subunit n=1 Tax=Methylophaga TaxID=40222 RepID=UPI002353E6E5|nr:MULTISPECIES: efflux RND transporter periplasmic adaptor subunit [Methylophaga]MEC9411239.1 efflux RND transporter periplasmic adaptor subunit [Pseudomonadota bacterium]
MKRNTISIGIAVALIGLGSFSAYHFAYADKQQEVTQNQQFPTVIVSHPAIENITEWQQYAGRFVAVNNVDIRSRVSGYLEKIHFKDGDIVNKGDLLFSIDPRPFKAEVSIAKATVEEREATLALAKTDSTRSIELYKTHAVSKQRVDEDKARVKQAEAQLSAAKSRLARAELDLDFTQITAPITGKIDQHNVDIGNLIRGDDENASPLTNIVSLDPIYVIFDVDQNTFLNLTNNETKSFNDVHSSSVRLSIQGDTDTKYDAKINFVSNSIDQQTGSIRLRAVVDNNQGKFTPGLFARVELAKQENPQTILIPEKALVLEQTDYVVYVVNDEDIVESRHVEVGPIANGLRVIRKGLNGDERVISGGLHHVAVGSKVAIQSELALNP